MQSLDAGDIGQQPQRATPERIMEMAWGFAPALILEAAVRHRVFDTLDAGPRRVEEVSSATGASVRGLRALMNALVGLGLLRHDGETYALTPESAAFLVSTKPTYHGRFFWHVARYLIPTWLELGEVLQTGKPAGNVNQETDGAKFFSQFVEDLLPVNYPAARALAEALTPELASRDGKEVEVLDVAAGSGVWGIAIAEKHPHVRVTAVDWPAVTPVAVKVAQRCGVGDRLRVVSGDILQADFGAGYRAATLGHILHSEGEFRARKLLRKVYDAMAPGGTIAIAEFMPDEGRKGPPQPLIFAVNMLLHTEDGDTFTFSEIAAWLVEAGFENPRTLPVPAPSPIVLATRPG